MPDSKENDPLHHTQKIIFSLEALIDHLRDDLQKIDEPRAEALFETSAEVLIGIKTAFEHYEEKAETAWR